MPGVRFSFWVRFSTVTPPVPAAYLLQITGSGTSMMVLGLNTNGTLRADGRNATGVNGSTTLSANTWYRVTFSYKIISTGNWGITIWLNGNSEIVTSNTQGSINQTGSDTLFLGIQISFDLFGATPNMTMWFDSLYMDNGTDLADPGTISVTAKRPFANGTTNGYTTQIGSGGSGYGSGHAPQVNERPASQTNGWSMIGAGSAVTEEYNIEGLSVGDVDLTAATLVDYTGWLISKSLAGETAQLILNNVTSNISLTSSVTTFTQLAGSTSYPSGVGKDIGEITSTGLTTVSLYEAGIVFAYIPGAGGGSPLFRVSDLSGLGAGGPHFQNPLG